MKENPYLIEMRRVISHLEREEERSIQRAAEMIVNSVLSGGAIYCSQIGHGIHFDWINRAGGLFAVRPFSYNISITDQSATVLNRRKGISEQQRQLENVRYALRISKVVSGDVMLIGSVSGRNCEPVELALVCREAGVKTIGFTSLEYSKRVESLHPSGKRLFEVVDVVVDNGAPYGDASVHMVGYDVPVLPVSGVSCLIAGWMIFARVLEMMADRGKPMCVYKSVNSEGGVEFNKEQERIFNERGY